MTTQPPHPDRPMPAPLTAAQYRVGMEVEVVDPNYPELKGRHLPVIMRTITGVYVETTAPDANPEDRDIVGFDPEHIRPVLRPVTDVTDAEWQAYWPGCEVVNREEDGNTLGAGHAMVGDKEYAVTVYTDGEMFFERDGGYGWLFRAADLIDYLDQIGADVRGYLLDGRAVAKDVNGQEV